MDSCPGRKSSLWFLLPHCILFCYHHFFGTPPLFRRVSLSGVMLILARMCILGAIRSVRVHGVLSLVGQLVWVSLANWLCCSWGSILKGGMALGGLNFTGKEIFFLGMQTVSLGGNCCDVIAWIHVYNPLIYHKEKTKATQHAKAYDTKLINIPLGVCSKGSWFQSF